MNLNTSSDIGARTTGYAVARLLTRGQHIMLTERFGQVDPQPKNKTLTRKYRRYHSLARAAAPLAEGIVPAGQRLSWTDITATLEYFGDVLWMTNVIKDTHEDKVGDEMYDLCGEQAAETIEVVRIAHLKAGSNVFYANSVAGRSSVVTGPAVADLQRIVRTFNRNKARPITKIISASADVSTTPVEAGYFAMCHTDLKKGIRALPGFVPVAQYSQHMQALPGEFGAIEEIRFLCSALWEPWLAGGASSSSFLTNGSSGTGNVDVYPIVIVAKDAYAIVPLQGEDAANVNVKNPSEISVANPLGQLGFVSWMVPTTVARLNELWMCRYEVAAPA